MNHLHALGLLAISLFLNIVNILFNSQTLVVLQCLAALGAAIYYPIYIYKLLKNKSEQK